MGGIGAFVFSFPFLHAFGLSIWFPVSLQIALIMFLFHLTLGIPSKIYNKKLDILLPCTLFFGVVPLFFFLDQAGIQNVLYTAAWFCVVLTYFWGGRIWLNASKVTLEQIGRVALVTVIFLSFSIVVEFTLANTIGLHLSDFLPFSISQFPQANVLGDYYLRPRGFTAEAGFTAVVFESLIPLAIYYVRNHRWKLILLLFLVAPGYILLFSAASMLSIFTALLIFYLTLSSKKVYHLTCIFAFVVTIILLYRSVPPFQWLFDQIVVRKLLEFSLPIEAVGVNDSFSRQEVYRLGLKLIYDFPFGIGWGMLSQMSASGVLLPGVEAAKGSGFISIPLEIFVCSGLIGGGLFLCFVIGKIRQVLQSRSEIAPYLFVSLTSVSLHHVVILEFWFPMFWFLLALSDYVTIQSKVGKRFTPTKAAHKMLNV